MRADRTTTFAAGRNTDCSGVCHALCNVCLLVLLRSRIKLGHDANVTSKQWNRFALACAVCLWLFMVYRRYRAGTEVEKLRKENTELNKKIQALIAEARRSGRSKAGPGKGRQNDRAAETNDGLMTPPALPRLAGKVAAASSRFVAEKKSKVADQAVAAAVAAEAAAARVRATAEAAAEACNPKQQS